MNSLITVILLALFVYLILVLVNPDKFMPFVKLTKGKKRVVAIIGYVAISLLCGIIVTPSNDKEVTSTISNDTIASNDTVSDSEKPKNFAILKDFKSLYDELQSFKTNPEFIAKGFGQSGPYYSWLQRAQKFNERKDALDLAAFGIAAGDLITLGEEYNSSRGKETENTQGLTKRIEYAFKNSTEISEDKETKEGFADKGNREVIGKWSVSNVAVPNGKPQIIEIYKKDGKYYVDENGDVSKLKKDGNEYLVVGNPQQESYRITSNGDLRLCDSEGDFTDEAGYKVKKIR